MKKVIPLIDLYDNAQSDTANYMSDLNDAMLLVVGNMELDSNTTQLQKDANVFHLVPPRIYNNGRENDRRKCRR